MSVPDTAQRVAAHAVSVKDVSVTDTAYQRAALRYGSTGHRVASYATAVQDIRYCSTGHSVGRSGVPSRASRSRPDSDLGLRLVEKLLAAWRSSVPDIA
eukprot:1746520-Rhodomonas_salina.4